MGQFIVALLIGGFFSTLVFALYHLIFVFETTGLTLEVEDTAEYDFTVNLPYSANLFRDPKNHPWMFTDAIMGNIINYFRSELKYYKKDFDRDESIELSHILYDKTHQVEAFFRETKRGKFQSDLFDQITQATFKEANEEKQFLLKTVFKEAHNNLINDLFAGKLHAH